MPLGDCDHSLTALLTNKYCYVPVSVLTAAPFSLSWGAPIFATVIAQNLYGDSAESQPGNGAYMLTNPSEPLNLREETSMRTASTLGLVWDQGIFDGGESVSSYAVSEFDADTGDYTLLYEVPNLTVLVYGLTFG